MARWLGLVALTLVVAGCRESVESSFIYFPSRALDADPAGAGLRFREVAFTAADGVKLYGWLVPGRTPITLLYSHGNGGNMAGRITITRMLADQLGVGVFIYDYRGYGRSEGTPSEAGLVADAQGARAALLREGVAPEHIVYYGRSLGAAVTVDLALAHPPRGVVLESPFASVRAMGNSVLPGAGYLFSTRWDSLGKIPKMRAPLLVLHSDADETIPFAQGRALFAAAPEPKTFFTIRGARHYDMQASWSEYWGAWRTFLEGLR
ncbi:MAG TPA: alpha/beta hydrolase [Methylomirabilota bacterium]|jgi:hypothetical protein|nr:alpha/beta hydrolase [Methylomirabilota bacterium]